MIIVSIVEFSAVPGNQLLLGWLQNNVELVGADENGTYLSEFHVIASVRAKKVSEGIALP